MKEWVQVKKSAFLLIEQLMALAIFAVSILLISGVYQVLLKVQNKLEVPNYIEWHLMATQMDTHLQGYARPTIVFEPKFEDGRPTKEGAYFIRFFIIRVLLFMIFFTRSGFLFLNDFFFK